MTQPLYRNEYRVKVYETKKGEPYVSVVVKTRKLKDYVGKKVLVKIEIFEEVKTEKHG